MPTYFEGETPTIISSGAGNNGGSMWNDGIWAILLLALLGNRGFGFGGNGGGEGGYGYAPYGGIAGYELGKVATTNDVASGFNNSAVLSSLNDIKLGQSQMQNFVNQGFAGLNTALVSEFRGTDNAICNLGYNIQAGINGISREIGDCCCKTNVAIQDLKYSNERQTCDIINAINASNQRLVDLYTSDKIDTLNRKLATAESQISQNAQTSIILNAVNRTPTPAYVVPNPYCCPTQCGGVASAIQ